MNLKNKKTVLDDDAALYSHREDVSEKEKWQTMSKKEKLRYFADYYLGRIVITAIVLALLGSLLYTILSPKPETVFSVGVINDAINQASYDALQEKWEAELALDAEKQQTIFDLGYTLNDYEYQSWQKFSMYNMVGDLDVSIMPYTTFETYAPGGFFSPIADHLSSGLYGALSDYLLMTKQEDDDGNLIPGSETVYGIDLSSVWPYNDPQYNNQQREEPMVLVINIAPKHKEKIETFLNFLFFSNDVK